jgi:hypothetical protein
VDFDGDGNLDLVSGSYDPGEIYLFRGEGKGKFAAREVIKDKNDNPILKVPNQKDRVESFGSWMALVDWDDDSDLDILVGTFDGYIFLRVNEGSRRTPAYAVANQWVTVKDKPLRVPGGAHANPVIADWDSDGRWDIVTGSGDGGAYWYRNAGERGKPAFEPPVALVAKHEGIGYSELLDPDAGPKPGIRSQIAVADYDQDGKLDVLLGDFCTYLVLRKDLTAEQRSEFKAIQAKQDETTKHLRDSMDALRERFKTALKGVPRSEWNSKENQEKWQKMYQEIRTSKEYKQRMEEYEQLQKQLQNYVEKKAGFDGGPGGPDTPRGFVWLFRRK